MRSETRVWRHCERQFVRVECTPINDGRTFWDPRSVMPGSNVVSSMKPVLGGSLSALREHDYRARMVGARSIRSSNFDMGHQPTADISNWFAPTTTGMRANHRFTLAARTVPVTAKVPASRKRIRCFFLTVVLTHDEVFCVSVEARCEFIGSIYPMGYKENFAKNVLIPLGVYRLFGCPLSDLSKQRPTIT